MLDRLVAAWDNGRDLICRDAPHLIVTHAPQGNLTAPSACTLALAYLELAAPSPASAPAGPGICTWGRCSGGRSRRRWRSPERYQFNGAMMVGEPRYRYQRLPLRREPAIAWR